MAKTRYELTPDQRQELKLHEKKEIAKELYFNYAKQSDISRDLGVKLPTLKTWIYGLNSKKDPGWKAEREAIKNSLLKELSSDKRGMVYQMVDNTLYLLYDFVDKQKQEVIKSGKPVDIKTASKLTSILMDLHTIVKNEVDEEDDIDFKKPTSIKELQTRVKEVDPFQKSEEEDVIIVENK